MNNFAYIGTKPCGCITRSIVIDVRFIKETAKAVSLMIGQGMTIDRVPVEEIRIVKCLHEPSLKFDEFRLKRIKKSNMERRPLFTRKKVENA